MKLNRKGFMLAEVTIVAAIAVVVMVSMYASSSRMIDAYETRENYYNVDTIYATGHIYNYLIDTLNLSKYINEYSSYKTIVDNGSVSDGYIKAIADEYNLNKVIFIKGSDVNNLVSNTGLNKTFRNYIDSYVEKNVDDGKYYLIVERITNGVNDTNKENYYYYYVEV